MYQSCKTLKFKNLTAQGTKLFWYLVHMFEFYACQMLIRHEKELEQIKRMNQRKEEELIKRQAVEKRALPKRIRTEMKAREMMFRESMRISMSSPPDPDEERDKLKKVSMSTITLSVQWWEEFSYWLAFHSFSYIPQPMDHHKVPFLPSQYCRLRKIWQASL